MTARKAAAPKSRVKPSRAAVLRAAGVRRATRYTEIPNGDGVMRCEPGDYIVTGADGTVAVKPPSVFAAEHPDLAG